MATLSFLVQGSAPEPYRVTFSRREARFIADCTCPAGDMGQFCKHRLGLLRGEALDIVSGNHTELGALRDLLAGTDMAAGLAVLDAAEAEVAAAKKRVTQARRALARHSAEDGE